MNANKAKSPHALQSDMARVDAHTPTRAEYDELPELTDDMLRCAVINRGGRPHATDPRKLVSIRLPESVLARWKATGAGWQTRMADRLAAR
jgi:uncharacterized protein (DUF4415 family)